MKEELVADALVAGVVGVPATIYIGDPVSGVVVGIFGALVVRSNKALSG